MGANIHGGRLGEVKFESTGARTNARRLEQWICDLEKPPRRGGECLRGEQG